MFSKILKTLKRWRQEKKDYKVYVSRIKKLPDDYRKVFKKINSYMWNFASGASMYEVLCGILDMFEEGVMENKEVIDIVGSDVGGFCDDILKEVPEKTWMDVIRKRVNKSIDKKWDKRGNV